MHSGRTSHLYSDQATHCVTCQHASSGNRTLAARLGVLRADHSAIEASLALVGTSTNFFNHLSLFEAFHKFTFYKLAMLRSTQIENRRLKNISGT